MCLPFSLGFEFSLERKWGFHHLSGAHKDSQTFQSSSLSFSVYKKITKNWSNHLFMRGMRIKVWSLQDKLVPRPPQRACPQPTLLPLPSYCPKWFWISFLFHKCPTHPTPSSPSHSQNSLKIMFRYRKRWKALTDLVNTTEFDVWVYFVINQSTLSLLRSHL